MTRDEEYMRLAIKQAKLAEQRAEAPIGAIVVCGGSVIASAYNTRESEKNALCHAELVAIGRACRALGGWRLIGCELYVTLEPCPMCAGAIINSRIKRVVYGAKDPKAGCAGSVCNLFEFPFNHKPELVGGVLEQECSNMLSEFFKSLRLCKQQNAELLSE
ncbi:MAG: tRNA adenosine(34) deaminase TadA [Oscillospiraceae bacterium]